MTNLGLHGLAPDVAERAWGRLMFAALRIVKPSLGSTLSRLEVRVHPHCTLGCGAHCPHCGEGPKAECEVAGCTATDVCVACELGLVAP